jgi:CRP-like cAMP-binding protein
VDLLERARTLAASPLLASLAPPVLVRLAARARAVDLDEGETCATGDAVWVVAHGRLTLGGAIATAGAVLGLIGVVASRAPATATALAPSRLLRLPADEVRDLLEEDPQAMAALADALATLLLEAPA